MQPWRRKGRRAEIQERHSPMLASNLRLLFQSRRHSMQQVPLPLVKLFYWVLKRTFFLLSGDR